MRNTKWNVKSIPSNREIVGENLNVDYDILKILYSRGIREVEDVRKFLNPKLENIQDPYGLFDMEKTVLEIENAIRENKNIWIYGDYDVDGITSTSVLYLALKELGAENVNYYIPIRDEGYGLNNEALKKIKESGADLVITVDCGITSFPEIEFANSIELPIIITDHHNLHGNKVPDAVAVVNPKRKENKFTFPSLAGVGTIFMVVLCLFERAGEKEKAYEYIDLVAIGTVADIVPLLEENRILTKFGLEKLLHSKNKGLNYLLYKLFFSGNKDQKENKTEYTTYDVGFIIAPVFNAAGRLKDAKMVVKLLISDNSREIEVIVQELIDKNFERKDLQNNIVEMVEKNIEDKNLKEDYIIVDGDPKYHHGVIGIAASKIVDKYNKPTIIMEIKEDQGLAVGSCRSIGNFNILEALQSMPELFLKFGGHSGAAGFTLPIKNIELLRKKINSYAKNILKEEDFVKIIEIDKQIPVQKISYEFFQLIDLLKPFGFGNPTPTFLTKSVFFENIKFIGENKNHIMFDVQQKGYTSRNAVWFNSGEFFKELNEGLIYDIVYKMKNELYQDRYYTKVYIEDVKHSKLIDDRLNYYYSLFTTSFPMKSVFYTNIDVSDENKSEISMKTEVDQISLFQGKKFIGRLDYNVSKLLMQLKEYYNWNFSVEIEKIKRTTTHNIIFITIKRDYLFKCYEVKDVGIFNKIKSFLLGKLEYNSFTKKMLAEFFRNDKNLVIENDFIDSNSVKLNRKNKNLSSVIKYILTVGMFYKTKLDKKSQIVVTEENEKIFATPLFKDYFDINNNVEDVREYPFTVFYEFDENEVLDLFSDELKNENEVEDKENANLEGKSLEIKNAGSEVVSEDVGLKVAEDGGATGNFVGNRDNREKENLEDFKNEWKNKFCVITNKKTDLDEKVIEKYRLKILDFKSKKSERIVYLSDLTNEERKGLKNIYVKYLPIDEKVRLKKVLEETSETIYCDNSIEEIL